MQIKVKTKYCDGLPSIITLKTTSGDVYISVENIEKTDDEMLTDESATLLGEIPEEFDSEISYLASLDISDIEEDMENGVDYKEIELTDYDGSNLILTVSDNGEGARFVDMSYENTSENSETDTTERALPDGAEQISVAQNNAVPIKKEGSNEADGTNKGGANNESTANSENAVRDIVTEHEIEAQLASMGQKTKWGAMPGKAVSDKLVMTEPKCGLTIIVPTADDRVDVALENNGYSLRDFSEKEQDELMQLAESASGVAITKDTQTKKISRYAR